MKHKHWQWLKTGLNDVLSCRFNARSSVSDFSEVNSEPVTVCYETVCAVNVDESKWKSNSKSLNHKHCMTIDKCSHHISSLCMNCACATWLIQGIKWSDAVDEWGTWAWKCPEKENKYRLCIQGWDVSLLFILHVFYVVIHQQVFRISVRRLNAWM